MEELKTAVKQGKQKKASGIDGICHELFQKTWETTKNDLFTIMNTMYMNRGIFDPQKGSDIMYSKKNCT
jgi:hypothetical protein